MLTTSIYEFSLNLASVYEKGNGKQKYDGI